MKFLTFITLTFILIVYIFFNLGKFLDVTSKPFKTELLVCLGGGNTKNRNQKTVDLYKNHFLKGKDVIFTGTKSINKKIYNSFDKDINIIINGKLKNTMEEILFIKDIVIEKNLSSVTIITEAPHSRRIKIFWEHFGEKLKDVKFQIVASDFDEWNKENYYKNKKALNYALSESVKLIYNFFLYGVLQTFGLKDTFENTYKTEIREIKKELNLTLK